jgi:hypothetical protein
MRQVWDAIPADPRPLNGGKLIEPHPGPFQVDIFFYWTGGTGSQSTRFEWMGGTKLHQPKEYPVSSQLWRSIYWAGQYHEHWMVWEFHRIRDVAVARSSTRPVEFTLWASGRITEDYWTFLPHAGKGAWNMDVDYKTIDPPFPPSGEPNH